MPSFPIVINATTDHVHVAGDSLVVGDGNTPPPGLGYLSPVAWLINAELMRRAAPSGIRRTRAGHSTPPYIPQSIAWTTDGISGTTLQALADNVSTRVMAYAPAGDGSNWKVFIDVSPNDWADGAASNWTNPATTILSTIRATKPNTTVCIVSSILGFGEKWQSGAACWGLNTSDDRVLVLNGIASGWCAANSVHFMDLRGTTISDPFTIANYESLHNTPEPGLTLGPIGNPLSVIHPSIPVGQYIVSNIVLNGWLSVVYP